MTEQPPPPPPPVSAGDRPSGSPPGNGPRLDGPPQTRIRRREMAVWGGGLAGLGVGVMAACLLHVIERADPAPFYNGGLGGTVALVILVAGPALGFGFGIIAAALIPDANTASASPPPTGPISPASGS